jgi:hypothetical protein
LLDGLGRYDINNNVCRWLLFSATIGALFATIAAPGIFAIAPFLTFSRWYANAAEEDAHKNDRQKDSKHNGPLAV